MINNNAKHQEKGKDAMRYEQAALDAMERGDDRAAFLVFRVLVRAGDHSFELNLVYCHDTGTGTRKNRAQAMFWYMRAYRAGDSAAASNIATVYRDEGRHDLEFAWYQRSAAMRDGDAELELARCYFEGVGVRRNVQRALDALNRAARSDCITEGSQEEAVLLLTFLDLAGFAPDEKKPSSLPKSRR